MTSTIARLMIIPEVVNCQMLILLLKYNPLTHFQQMWKV